MTRNRCPECDNYMTNPDNMDDINGIKYHKDCARKLRRILEIK